MKWPTATTGKDSQRWFIWDIPIHQRNWNWFSLRKGNFRTNHSLKKIRAVLINHFHSRGAVVCLCPDSLHCNYVVERKRHASMVSGRKVSLRNILWNSQVIGKEAFKENCNLLWSGQRRAMSHGISILNLFIGRFIPRIYYSLSIIILLLL